MKYKTRFLTAPFACLALLAFFAISTSASAVEMFLKIEGEIKGESNDDEHKDDIDVLAWSWGASNAGSFHLGGGGGSGKANFQDISITKYVDKASATLLLHVANGAHFASATLTVRRGGPNSRNLLVIKMTKVFVTSVSTGGSVGEDRLTENISLNFEQVEVKYIEQKEDGTEGETKEFKWNIGANAPK